MNRLAALIAVALAGCVKIPDSYAPPAQRVSATDWARKSIRHFVSMDQADATNYALSDVLPTLESGGWRWTLRRPRFQFLVPTTQGMKLRVDHTVPEITFQQTGPVQISVFVEDHLLEVEKFDKPGQRIFEKAVPPEWLATDHPVQVRFEIDKMWKSPVDGAERGFIITRLGFVQ